MRSRGQGCKVQQLRLEHEKPLFFNKIISAPLSLSCKTNFSCTSPFVIIKNALTVEAIGTGPAGKQKSICRYTLLICEMRGKPLE
jgi:hypothetical protein